MKQFLSLARLNAVMSFYQLNMAQRRGKRGGHGLMYGIGALVVVLMGYLTFWAVVLSRALNSSGYEWVILPIALVIVTFFIFALSIYTLDSLLFESSDTDQLFAYPIPKFSIVAGKIAGLVIENWLIVAVFWLPFVGVYTYFAHPGPLFFVFALLCLIIVPSVPLFVVGLISYVVGLVTSGTRYRRLYSVLLTLLIIAGMGWGLSRAIGNLQLQSVSGDVFGLMQKYYPPVGYMTTALVHGSIGAMGMAILWNVVPFVALCGVVSLSYGTIRSRVQAVGKAKSGRVTYTSTTASRAIFGKEISRLIFSPMYLLNSCMTGVVLVVFVVLLGSNAKKMGALFTALENVGVSLAMIMLILFMFLLSVTNTTAPSISLEGQGLWIIKSLPVSVRAVLRSKLLVQVCVVVPIMLIAAVLALFTRHVGASGFLLIVAPSFLFILLSACVGLAYNLHYYRFDFFNDQQVVKNGASVFLTIGTMLATAAVAIFGYWLLGRFLTVNFWVYWAAWLVILAVAVVVLFRYLMTTGVELFEELS